MGKRKWKNRVEDLEAQLDEYGDMLDDLHDRILVLESIANSIKYVPTPAPMPAPNTLPVPFQPWLDTGVGIIHSSHPRWQNSYENFWEDSANEDA